MTIITNNIFDDSNQLLRDRYSQHMVAFPASYTDEDLPYIDISTKPNILYVHIPFCSGKCHYCSYVTKTPKDFSEVDNYLSYLEKEAKLLYEKSNHKPEIKSIYIGGGTPSILNIDQLKVLFKILDTYFDLSDLKEYTLEGCPETYSYEKAMFAKDNGITRASIGVESFDDHILRNMNRRHDSTDAKQVINDILSAGLELDIDLITCYPGYTEDKIIKDLDTKKYPGFTFVKDMRVQDNVNPILGFTGRKEYVGIRAQYIPEFDGYENYNELPKEEKDKLFEDQLENYSN